MTSFQDAPDENIEHDEKMELRSTLTIGEPFINIIAIFCYLIQPMRLIAVNECAKHFCRFF